MQQQRQHKQDYATTQQIGKQMRNLATTSFSYIWARCSQRINVGVFDINAIHGEPMDITHWEIKQTGKDFVFQSGPSRA